MAQSPAGKPRKTPKPAVPKKAAGSSASKPKAKAPAPAPKAKPPAQKAPATRVAPRKKPAPPSPPAQEKRAPAKKAAAKSPLPALADTEKAPQDEPQLGLTQKQQRFVEEYLVDLNATQAAIRAGYSPDTAKQIACENLSKPYLQLAIAEARRKQAEKTGINADLLLTHVWNVATADPREIVEIKVGCCRYCYGENHKKQRTVGEMNRDMEAWAKAGGMPADFDQHGGIGYTPHKGPHPDCPECFGDGHPREVIHDTRYLSPAAAQLFAGVKIDKSGRLTAVTHSKEAFAEKLMKHLGLYEKDNQQKTDPLAALINRLTNGNANGFKPVAIDPEHPGDEPKVNGFTPQQEPGDGD